MMHPERILTERRQHLTRRWFFRDCGAGVGAIALGRLLLEGGDLRAAPASLQTTTLPSIA